MDGLGQNRKNEKRLRGVAPEAEDGRVGRNRTHINGFGDRRTAIVLLPCGNLPLLLNLFVKSALALRGAVLLHLHTVGLRALVAGRRVVATLAFGASQYC